MVGSDSIGGNRWIGLRRTRQAVLEGMARPGTTTRNRGGEWRLRWCGRETIWKAAEIQTVGRRRDGWPKQPASDDESDLVAEQVPSEQVPKLNNLDLSVWPRIVPKVNLAISTMVLEIRTVSLYDNHSPFKRFFHRFLCDLRKER